MEKDQIQRKLDLLHAEMDSLHRQNVEEGGFLTSDERSLRLKSLYAEENILEDELLRLEAWS